MSSKPFYHFDLASPVGTIRISGDDEFIHEVEFVHRDEFSHSRVSAVIQQCARQLDEYFSGTRKSFSLPVILNGTDFQKRIWTLLQQIPYGKTISYLDLAIQAGNSNLVRAVGLANGANKLAIIIPCHRVIGSNGKLIGYGGGLWRKDWLLKFEQRDLQPELFAAEKFSEKA